MNNTLKQLQEKGEIEDLLTRELDVLENAIDDENRELAICSREEIWKLVYRLVEAGKAEVIAMVLKEIEKQKSEYNYETQDEWDGYRYAKQEIIDTLKTKLKAKE